MLEKWNELGREQTGEPELLCSIGPAAMGAIGAGVGIAGGLIGAATGAGKTDWRAQGYDPNANAFQFGGRAGGANERAGEYVLEGRAALNRDDINNNRFAQQSRGAQMGALDLQRQAAMGQAPSAAQIQMQRGLQQAATQNAAIAAGARGGPMARMAAQRAAAIGGEQAAAEGLQATAQLRAEEMARARGDYMQGASAFRGADLQGNIAQRQANDQFGLGMFQGERDIQKMQLDAQMREQELRQRNQAEKDRINAQIEMGNAGANQKYIDTAVGGAMGGLQGGMAGGKGGG